MVTLFIIVSFGILLLLVIVPPLVLAKYFVKQKPESKALRIPILTIQAITYILLFFIPLPPGIWALGYGALLIYVAYGVIALAVGLLLYPPLYLFFYKPSNSKTILVIYLLLTGFIFIPIASTFIDNYIDTHTIDNVLYGKVIDLTGKPAGGALITLGSGRYYIESTVQADKEGRFIVESNSTNRTIILKIQQQTDGATCKSRTPSFNNHRAETQTEGQHQIGTKNHPAIFECAWGRAEFLIRKKGILYATIENKAFFINPYTGAIHNSLPENLDTILKLDIHFSGEIEQRPNTGHFSISAVNGGILEVKDGDSMDIAPQTGYQNQYMFNFEGLNERRGPDKNYYYKLNDGYGDITIGVGRIYKDGLQLRLEYSLSLIKSRNLIGYNRDNMGIHPFTPEDINLNTLFKANDKALILFDQGQSQKAGQAIIDNLIPRLSKEYVTRDERRAIGYSFYNLGQMAEKSELYSQAIENYTFSLRHHDTAIVQQKIESIQASSNAIREVTSP